jgi:hypothetical protein
MVLSTFHEALPHIWSAESRVEVGSNTSTVILRVVVLEEGSLESETVKYGSESHGTRTREWLRWRRPASSLVRESASHKQTHKCVTVIKIWSYAPDECLTPRQTGRLTVDHKNQTEGLILFRIISQMDHTGGWIPWQLKKNRGKAHGRKKTKGTESRQRK